MFPTIAIEYIFKVPYGNKIIHFPLSYAFQWAQEQFFSVNIFEYKTYNLFTNTYYLNQISIEAIDAFTFHFSSHLKRNFLTKSDSPS